MVGTDGAFPPILLPRPGNNLIWSDTVILARMPLFGEFWINRGKRVGN
jgi:hypothetical protein